MKKITADMTVSRILDLDDEIEQVFLSHGLHCAGCPGGEAESLREAAAGHMVDLERLLADLNHYIETK